MYIQQLYTGCLAEAAYYIESHGEAVIIDPLRETDPYIELAKQRNAKIKYIFETHFHADFVSGHIDLSKKTHAPIVYGPDANAGYDIINAHDNEEFYIGNVKIKVLHTPGHTPESTCYLLIDEKDKPYAVFTGDTLFVGDVGRPDLAVKSGLTKEDLAGKLYDSLNQKIKTLPDDVLVYPAHGAGSACGKNIGKETYSTIGEQKEGNYAMQDMSKDEFVKVVTEGLTTPPKYFFMDAAINMKGYESIDEVMKKNLTALDADSFESELQKGAIVLDAREAGDFEQGYIPGAINIGLNGQYAPWVGALLDEQTPILLITDKGKEEEAVLRLARVGYENVKGYLADGLDGWRNAGKQVEKIESIDPADFADTYNNSIHIIDVRNPGEWAGGTIEGAELIALGELQDELKKLDKTLQYYVHCAGGYRSMMATSLMKKYGFEHVINVRGGINKIKETAVPIVMPAEMTS